MDDVKKENKNANDHHLTEDKTSNVIDNDVDDQREKMPDFRRDEETASEITGFDDNLLDRDDHVGVDKQIGNIPGWIGLAVAVLSFFMMPIILGAAGIIVGFIAKSRDANWLGNTAITLGVISIIMSLFFIPFG